MCSNGLPACHEVRTVSGIGVRMSAAVLAVTAAAGAGGGFAAAATRRTATPKSRVEWRARAAGILQTCRSRAGTVLVGAGVFLFLAIATTPAIAVVPAAALAAAPRAAVERARRRQIAQRHAAWPDVLRDLLAALGAGQSLPQALEAVGRDGPPPLRDTFARFAALHRAVGTVPALETLREELDDPMSDRVFEVLVLASERGSAIVRRVLEDLVGAITADIKLADELDTAVLESRINARAVVALPWTVLIVLNLGNGPFRSFYASPAGFVVVLVGALLSVVGMLCIARLGRLPVEPRVFGKAAHA
jgi:tight adherence protein B